MLPQPDHHDENSTERRDPVPYSEADLEWRFRCRNSLEGARRSAMKAALMGSLPVVLFCIVEVIKTEIYRGLVSDQLITLIVCWFGWMICLPTLYVLMTGIVSGWIAHRFAFETAVPVSRLAIALAWVANLSLWGWAVVVAMTDS